MDNLHTPNPHGSDRTPALFGIDIRYSHHIDDSREILVSVVDLSNVSSREHQTFKKTAIVSIDISRFCGAAIVRLNELANADKPQEDQIKVFELEFSTPGISKGLKIEGDDSIKEIFGSLIQMADAVSNEIISCYDMKTGVPDDVHNFSKFYLIDNRAISFKKTISQEKQSHFLELLAKVPLKNDPAEFNTNTDSLT